MDWRRPNSIRYYDKDGHICMLVSEPYSGATERVRGAVYRVCIYEKARRAKIRMPNKVWLGGRSWMDA